MTPPDMPRFANVRDGGNLPSAAQETLSVLLNICALVVCIGLGLVVAHIALTALMGA